MAAKKNLTDAAKLVAENTVNTVKEVAPVVEEAIAETTKAVKKKASETAATVKKTATKAKKTVEKKTSAKKTATVEQEVMLQFAGKEASADELVARAKEAWLADGGDLNQLKKISVYVKPEENMVYYVVNGTNAGSFAF